MLSSSGRPQLREGAPSPTVPCVNHQILPASLMMNPLLMRLSEWTGRITADLFTVGTNMGKVMGSSKRRALVGCIMMVIAAAHIFRLGSHLHGRSYIFYYSYFSDFILPFGLYFLLCAPERQTRILGSWQVKLAIAFLLPSIAETCQYSGVPVLGSTFDPLDYLAYGLGATSAVIVDTQVFSRLVGFWTTEKTEE